MKNRQRSKGRLLLLLVFLILSYIGEAQMQKLRISDNHRFLVYENGDPFIWIGETNWFFAKLPPKAIDSILDTRSTQGYSTMLVSCREKLYNGEGPGPVNDPNELWWNYLDDYVSKCEQRGLYVGITLGWWGVLLRYTEEELSAYGKWVGERYRDKNNIIWLTLGESGSYARKKEIPQSKLQALVKGIREGDSGNKLLTVHADYKRGTSITEDRELCDFNNWQTSQWCCPDSLPKGDNREWQVWEAIQYDYNKQYHGKPKPTIDLEARYENNKDFCGSTPFGIRRRAYFTIFAGAFGHNYGAGGIWDGLISKQKCSEDALGALQYPGAIQVGYISKLLHSLGKEFLKIAPNQSIIKEGNTDSYDTHIQATVANDNTFSLVYSASDAPYKLNLQTLVNRQSFYRWYNPRTNVMQSEVMMIENRKAEEILFDPPGEKGAGNDWVLVVGTKDFIDKVRLKLEK